jgi:hypothetical protein
MRLNKTVMTLAINKVVEAKACEVLEDQRIFLALLKDALGDNKLEVRTISRIIKDTNICSILFVSAKESSGSEVERTKKLFAKTLKEELFFADEGVRLFLEVFSNAFTWKVDFTPPDQSLKNQPKNDNIRNDETPDLSILTFGGMEWLVLKYVSKDAFLLTKDLVAAGIPYHDSNAPVTWKTSSIRKWLNETFINRFSTSEQERIILNIQKNDKNPWYGSGDDEHTSDKVFLLSVSELIEHMGDSGGLEKRSDNGWVDELLHKGKSCAIDDEFNTKRRAKYKDNHTWWWLRTPGYSELYAAYVNINGIIFLNGENVVDDGGSHGHANRPGVRPAIWLRID